ncbi:MAG TPA: DUF4837 family protein [Fodinibius sp.]|nr:DUF4837 family protein [Fodinibius sp.]
MKSLLKFSLFALIALVWVGCEGDYRPKASGGFGEVVVVMDSTQWESATAKAIRNTYGKSMLTLPGPEPRFDLRFRDFKSKNQWDRLKKFKNIIIAAPINDSTNTASLVRSLLSDQVEEQVQNGESFAFPLNNKWYQDQWSVVLTAPNDSALAKQINNSETTLVDRLMEKEFERWKEEIYDRGEQLAVEDSLWKNHGWKIRIQHDWNTILDTVYTSEGEKVHFMRMNRLLPENSRWFWVWWKNDVRDISYLDNDWINARRDSLMRKWVRGTRDSSYITTEYRRPVETSIFKMNDDLTYETRGTWRMTHDAMGGPFVNFTVYDEEANRLFMLEFLQFAPEYDKRRFVRQFRVMLRTFQSDSTWQSSRTSNQ